MIGTVSTQDGFEIWYMERVKYSTVSLPQCRINAEVSNPVLDLFIFITTTDHVIVIKTLVISPNERIKMDYKYVNTVSV